MLAIGSRSGRSSEYGDRRVRGFTLVEVVIVLTVVGILTGIAVPTITGVIKQREARQPVSELLRLARSVRQRAIDEEVPYQVAFDSTGFHAARFYSPYGESEEFAQVLQEMEELEQRRKMVEASRDRFGDLEQLAGVGPGGANASAAAEASEETSNIFYETYELPDGVDYELLFWGQSEWVPMQPGRFERWVFQPSGMSQPLKIRVSMENAFFEVEFHPLTGDVKNERGWVE